MVVSVGVRGIVTSVTAMTTERRVRLFRNGRNQAVRIPREFELEGDEAIMRQEGDVLIIEPVIEGGLLSLLERLKPIEEPFPDVDEGLLGLDEPEISDEAAPGRDNPDSGAGARRKRS